MGKRQARQIATVELYQKAVNDALSATLQHVIRNAVSKLLGDYQERSDEEGCGAAFAAMKYTSSAKKG